MTICIEEIEERRKNKERILEPLKRWREGA
jgi:hypothetical protein